jgi:hypothetical protein
VLGVETDRFEHEIECVGAIDFVRYTVSHFGLNELSFAEVVEPVNPLRVAVPEQIG